MVCTVVSCIRAICSSIVSISCSLSAMSYASWVMEFNCIIYKTTSIAVENMPNPQRNLFRYAEKRRNCIKERFIMFLFFAQPEVLRNAIADCFLFLLLEE